MTFTESVSGNVLAPDCTENKATTINDCTATSEKKNNVTKTETLQ